MFAEKILDASETRVAVDWRKRVFELADALFESIKMQTSVPKYKAISVGRGATLDTVDVPLNNRLWLKQRFAALRSDSAESERLKGIDEIVNWTNPGPGGFYDDAVAAKLVEHLFQPANSVDPGEAYRRFRGRDAQTDALMRDRGFPTSSAEEESTD